MRKFLTSLFKENEVVKSFAYNLQTKSTNPFFGTLILVWLVRNWELVYTFFNFDSDTKLPDRIAELKLVSLQVFKAEIFGYDFSGYKWDLIFCVFITIFVMLITFIFMAFTKYISGIYQDRVLPNIYERTSTYRIKRTEEFEGLDKSLYLIREELKKEKDDKLILDRENEELTSENEKLKTELNQEKREHGECKKELFDEKSIKSKKENEVKDLSEKLRKAESEVITRGRVIEDLASDISFENTDLQSYLEEKGISLLKGELIYLDKVSKNKALVNMMELIDLDDYRYHKESSEMRSLILDGLVESTRTNKTNIGYVDDFYLSDLGKVFLGYLDSVEEKSRN
ncbi:hypothetical protein DF185_08010 [Marinifilum breve]|uniref:Uncharacterized protein n=1 Tax=Marinifilum breve TaxID=2184082 RepID=A0A2V4A265_9BACT|nr:hypothetical protein [Marinifilum breve]PXY01420.1 hypothetical protein DF185_08010 [Marinifilum breve]